MKAHVTAAALCAALLALSAWPANALPAIATLLGDLGFSADEIAQVQAGKIITATMKPASDRELVAAMAFHVQVPPAELVKDVKAGLLLSVDPNTIATGLVSPAPALADFAALKLEPDPEKQAQSYRSASPGGDLNLSAEEIAAFGKLGGDASVAAVEGELRNALLARVEAYRSKGLAGIAPYAKSGGKERSAADELRTASAASTKLKTYVPAAYELLLSYPQSKPPGTEESFRWTELNAHGVPTITLTHGIVIPDGDARIVLQRQFYVSTGYNSEQAIAAFLPVETGTVVFYANRTSTDQVTGFGGGAKRSIGSKILASQLQGLFEKVRAAAVK